MCHDTGHAQRILVGFGAGVDEEDATECVWRLAEQFFGGQRTHLERNGIALEQQLCALFPDRGA